MTLQLAPLYIQILVRLYIDSGLGQILYASTVAAAPRHDQFNASRVGTG
jgi:hypothetical protein